MDNERIIPNISEIPVKIAAWSTGNKHRLSNLHYHNEIELLACRGGTISAVVNNVKYYINDGEVLFLNSRVPHETFDESGGAESMFIQFRIERFLPNPSEDITEYLTYLRRNTTETVQLIKDTAILDAMCAISDENQQKGAGYRNLIYAGIHTICGKLIREKIFSDDANTDIQSLQKLAPALVYVDKNYASELSLDDVSAAAGLNKYYFCRLFKKACGIGFSEYLNLVRVFKTEKMLKKTDKTVLEIALDSGFSSISYFNSIFKKYKGCTPTAYRNAVKFNM